MVRCALHAPPEALLHAWAGDVTLVLGSDADFDCLCNDLRASHDGAQLALLAAWRSAASTPAAPLPAAVQHVVVWAAPAATVGVLPPSGRLVAIRILETSCAGSSMVVPASAERRGRAGDAVAFARHATVARVVGPGAAACGP